MNVKEKVAKLLNASITMIMMSKRDKKDMVDSKFSLCILEG